MTMVLISFFMVAFTLFSLAFLRPYSTLDFSLSMEALGILKFWRNSAAGDEVHGAAFVTDEEETDEDDSFFDLVFKSPASCEGGNEGLKKDFEFEESPRDVFLSKNELDISKPLSPAVTLLRSTPKFKVFMLGFKRTTKCEKVESCGELKASPSNQFSKPSKIERGNRFSVKCSTEEMPIATVLGRENSLRSRLLRDNDDDETFPDGVPSVKSIPRYLRLIRPFQMKASKKAKLTNSVTPSHSPVTAPVNLSPSKFSVGSRSVGSFKIVARNLVKSRSASAASAMSVAPPPVRRRDDSLLEQHDGIQGAILHCKKSYNSSSSKEFSQLFQSPNEEQKRRSI